MLGGPGLKNNGGQGFDPPKSEYRARRLIIGGGMKRLAERVEVTCGMG